MLWTNSGLLALVAAISTGIFPMAAGFGIVSSPLRTGQPYSSTLSAEETSSDISIVDEEPDLTTSSAATATVVDPEGAKIKQEFLELADRTNRGFQASNMDRKRARELIYDLARFNPSKEPASPYYSKEMGESSSSSATLAGKWTLVYTDAPDITGLDTSRNPLSTAKLGRIGQECKPPYIKNVIEYRRPDWAANLPFSGTEDSRVLQKIVTSGSATPDKPFLVELKAVGLELEAGEGQDELDTGDFVSLIQKKGLPAGLLMTNPVDLKGPLTAPFGRFEILYLDDEFRVIKTYQNYIAANRRIKEGEEWF
jgi:hypothetical protein